jgi:four helix bundle protein
MKFDFQKLEVYKKAKAFHEVTRSIVSKNCVTGYYNDQICRASFSVVLNIAEGSGRFSKADRKNFFIIARSSVFECVAAADVLKDKAVIEETDYNAIESLADELSRMLYTMIQNLHK